MKSKLNSLNSRFSGGAALALSRSLRPASGRITLRRTMDFLRTRCHSPIAVDDLAAALKMSRRGLHNVFVRHTGHGPGRELRRLRMQRAQQLLLDSDWNLKVVAALCGYKSVNSFWVAFRRDNGMTPGRYRENQAARSRCSAPGLLRMDPVKTRSQKLHTFLLKREKNHRGRAGKV